MPFDLKNLSKKDLKALCKELRSEIISVVSGTGGKLIGLRFLYCFDQVGRMRWPMLKCKVADCRGSTTYVTCMSRRTEAWK